MKVEQNINSLSIVGEAYNQDSFSDKLNLQNMVMNRRGSSSAAANVSSVAPNVNTSSRTVTRHGLETMANPHHPTMAQLPVVAARNSFDSLRNSYELPADLRSLINEYISGVDNLLAYTPPDSNTSSVPRINPLTGQTMAVNSSRPPLIGSNSPRINMWTGQREPAPAALQGRGTFSHPSSEARVFGQGRSTSIVQTPDIRREKNITLDAFKALSTYYENRKPETYINHVEGRPPLQKRKGAPALTSLLQAKMVNEDLSFLNTSPSEYNRHSSDAQNQDFYNTTEQLYDYTGTPYQAVKEKYIDTVPQDVRTILSENQSSYWNTLENIIHQNQSNISHGQFDKVIERGVRLRRLR